MEWLSREIKVDAESDRPPSPLVCAHPEAGLKRIQVVVPAERVEEIRAIAARMVEDSDKQGPQSPQ